MRKVTIIGAGPGNPDLLSRAALDAIDIADVVIGAHRALAGIDVPPDVVRCELVKTADIVAALTDAASWQRAVVVMTGDVGLFSGARRLVEALSGDAQLDVRVIPGISSASYLAARLARPWQDWRFASAHGVACDIVAEAERTGELFLVTSGGEDPSRLSGELVQAGFGDARVTVAERLSYPDERITCATASEIAGQTFDDLNVMLIEFAGGAGSPASSRWPYASSGIPDELFIRGDVPMTKQEVRAVALAKLRLTATDTVWDVGAGTGSVSIEAALVARAGSVWAVERNAAGVRLIRENADVFGRGHFAVDGRVRVLAVSVPDVRLVQDFININIIFIGHDVFADGIAPRGEIIAGERAVASVFVVDADIEKGLHTGIVEVFESRNVGEICSAHLAPESGGSNAHIKEKGKYEFCGRS